MSEQHTCELCGSAVEVVSSGEGTNSYRPLESERIEATCSVWKYEGGDMSDKCGLGEGTHYACPCMLERIAKLERLVKDAERYVEYAADNHINDYWSVKGLEWLTRYREMFTPEVKK